MKEKQIEYYLQLLSNLIAANDTGKYDSDIIEIKNMLKPLIAAL